jgi:putative ABC transport system permease protein
MKHSHSFSIAIKALRANKVRTALTVLGMVIGIMSVSVIISAGDSIKKLVYNQVSSFGSNFIQIESRAPKASGGSFAQVQGVVVTSMKLSDKEAVDKIKGIKASYASSFSQEIMAWEGNIKKVTVFAAGPELIDIDETKIAAGRFYNKEEDDGLAWVVVLGSNVKDKLFGNNSSIGQNVKIRNINFKVIGEMESKGTVFFFNYDDLAYIPVQTTQKVLLGINYISSITAQMEEGADDQQVAEDIRILLRDRHEIDNPDKDDFEVNTSADAQNILGTILGGVTLLLIALAGISLVVGGVGIMNIMYATVSERTFEIGLRKSIGASERDIMQQFLAEAVTITLLGGIGGIILGIFLTYIIYFLANY